MTTTTFGLSVIHCCIPHVHHGDCSAGCPTWHTTISVRAPKTRI